MSGNNLFWIATRMRDGHTTASGLNEAFADSSDFMRELYGRKWVDHMAVMSVDLIDGDEWDERVGPCMRHECGHTP